MSLSQFGSSVFLVIPVTCQAFVHSHLHRGSVPSFQSHLQPLVQGPTDYCNNPLPLLFKFVPAASIPPVFSRLSPANVLFSSNSMIPDKKQNKIPVGSS